MFKKAWVRGQRPDHVQDLIVDFVIADGQGNVFNPVSGTLGNVAILNYNTIAPFPSYSSYTAALIKPKFRTPIICVADAVVLCAGTGAPGWYPVTTLTPQYRATPY